MLQRNLSFLLVTLALLSGIPAAHAAPVAYGYDSENKERPLPENIDKFDAKYLVRVKWSSYAGEKIRVAVLPIENKLKAVSTTTDKAAPAESSESKKLESLHVPVEDIESILISVLDDSGRFRIVDITGAAQATGQSADKIDSPLQVKASNVPGAKYNVKAVITSYEPNSGSSSASTKDDASDTKDKDSSWWGTIKETAKKLSVSVGTKKSLVAMSFQVIDTTTSEIILTAHVQSDIGETTWSAGDKGVTVSNYSKTPIGQAALATITKGVYELVKKIGPASQQIGNVVKVADSKSYINLGEGSVKVGDELKAFTPGAAMTSPGDNKPVVTFDNEIGTLKVVEIQGQYSRVEAIGPLVSALKEGDKVKPIRVPLEFGQDWTN